MIIRKQQTYCRLLWGKGWRERLGGRNGMIPGLRGFSSWQNASVATLRSPSAPKDGQRCSIIIYIGLSHIHLASTEEPTDSFRYLHLENL